MRYILIIGSGVDPSLDEVLHWLKYLDNTTILRLGAKDSIAVFDIEVNNDCTYFSLKINDDIIKSSEIDFYYYRRGDIKYDSVIPINLTEKSEIYNSLLSSLDHYYRQEQEHITDFIHYLLQQTNINSLNSYFDNKSNKLINLEVAKSIGLNIPNTIITNSVEKIRSFLAENEKVITKPMRFSGYYFKYDKKFISYSQPTSYFTIDDLNEISETQKKIKPTLFQEYIEKDFEIRTYYMDGECHSMAIFSQKNEKTALDFRNYDRDLPNRNVPYKLPADIEQKIEAFMKASEYDTGSIDIIYRKGEYVFLEVNTNGIFQWLSKNCNYYLEKKIGQHIISSIYDRESTER